MAALLRRRRRRGHQPGLRGVHHASDVVAGAVLGAAMATCAQRLWPLPVDGPSSDPPPCRRAESPATLSGLCPTSVPMTDFAVTWDYRCPFARNAHEHVIAGLRAGPTGTCASCRSRSARCTWPRASPTSGSGPTTTAACSPCRPASWCATASPTRFLDVHRALFAAPPRRGQAPARTAEVRRVLAEARRRRRRRVRRDRLGGAALDRVREEHTAAADDHEVWGVPTFISGDAGRLRPAHGPAPGRRRGAPRRTIERVVDLLAGFPELNEFKHTSLKR